MDRLTDKSITKACNDPWDYCGLDYVCTRDCHKPEPCRIPKLIHRLAEIEDILGDEYDLGCLRELVEADRAGRCVVLPVLPALRPGSRGSEIFILLDSGEIAEDAVHDISIGLNSRGEMNVVFSTFDSGDFETADIGKRIFWDIKSAQQAASSLKGEPPC